MGYQHFCTTTAVPYAHAHTHASVEIAEKEIKEAILFRMDKNNKISRNKFNHDENKNYNDKR